jgi:hypothetical protein
MPLAYEASENTFFDAFLQDFVDNKSENFLKT